MEQFSSLTGPELNKEGIEKKGQKVELKSFRKNMMINRAKILLTINQVKVLKN
jgi:hypothetical protein